MENLEIRGIELLTDAEKFELNKEIENYGEKLRWKTKSDFAIDLQIKIHSKKKDDKDNKRRNYSLHAKVTGETQTFEASADDWEFNKAIHMIFDKLLNEIEHKYHSSDQRSSMKK